MLPNHMSTFKTGFPFSPVCTTAAKLLPLNALSRVPLGPLTVTVLAFTVTVTINRERERKNKEKEIERGTKM